MIDYKGIRVLVTGGLGFIGLNTVSALLDAGAKVTIAARTLHPASIEWLKLIARNRQVTVLQGDICDESFISKALDNQQVVFNLAGQSGAAKSILQANVDMYANIQGHLNILQVVAHLPVSPRIIFVSSRLVYGMSNSQPVDETHPQEPTSIYGLHKLTVEHYYRLYQLHHGIPYTILRLTNPYGAYQRLDQRGYGVVNLFLMQAVRGETITIYGDGKQLRDYIYVRDVVNAMLATGLHPDVVGRTFNLGFGKAISISEMADLIVQIAGRGTLRYIPWPTLDRKVETGDFVCDTKLLCQTLNWQPLYDWSEGIQESIDIYLKLISHLG